MLLDNNIYLLQMWGFNPGNEGKTSPSRRKMLAYCIIQCHGYQLMFVQIHGNCSEGKNFCLELVQDIEQSNK